jgi:hypothetical protein
MKPFHATFARDDGGSPDQCGPNALPLVVRMYCGVQYERMDASIPGHIHKAD